MPPKRKPGVDLTSIAPVVVVVVDAAAAPPPALAAPIPAAAYPAAAAALAPPANDAVSQLVSMGFLKANAEAAYKQHGSLEKALNALLASNAPVPQPTAIYMPAAASPSPSPAAAAPKKKKAKKLAQKGSYAGKSICFTGALTLVRREAEALAAARGMRVTKTVSSKTDFVVAGPGAGSKLGKAEDNGTTIWSEEDFKNFLEDASDSD